MMFIIYDLIFLILAIIYLPIYLFRRKFHQGFLARLGFLPLNLKLEQPIWIHAVSVGEVMAIKELLKELRRAYPAKRFVISTVTATGNKIARRIAETQDFVTYLPLDFSFIVRGSLNKIKPSLFIIVETEIWPNLITQLYRRKVPVILVNARISDRAFSGYRKIKLLLIPILEKISFFCAQTDRDMQRFQALGVPQDKIRVTGNMKFDIEDYAGGGESKRAADYKAKLGLKDNEKILVAGSTHPGEEEIVLDTYKKLTASFPSLGLLIAPRHPERTKVIEKLIIKYNLQPLSISQIGLRATSYELRPVFILDTIGQLMDYYAIADIVFVGGSLVAIGGHNILEPASLGKPVLFGPYMFNFRDIAQLFLVNKAAVLVNNKEELKQKIKDFLIHPEDAQYLSRNAKQLILNNAGATKRNLDLIRLTANGD